MHIDNNGDATWHVEREREREYFLYILTILKKKIEV